MRSSTKDEYERRILRAQQLLVDRLDETIEPAELAKVACFSLHHFHRIFRACMGESVMQHVRRLRLERAARTMRASPSRLLDVAIEAGYESHEAFTRAFTDHFGVPPSEYRAQPNRRVEAWLGSSSPRSLDVRVERCDAVRVAFMRHRGGYRGVEETWARLVELAKDRKLLRAEPCLYGICPDDPEVTKEELLRFDACVAVDESFADRDVGIAMVPAGTYAIGVHAGPYHRLSETYLDVIGHWFPGSGYELAPEPVIEHYLNDPSTASPDELRTEVRVRIAD